MITADYNRTICTLRVYIIGGQTYLVGLNLEGMLVYTPTPLEQQSASTLTISSFPITDTNDVNAVFDHLVSVKKDDSILVAVANNLTSFYRISVPLDTWDMAVSLDPNTTNPFRDNIIPLISSMQVVNNKIFCGTMESSGREYRRICTFYYRL